MSVWTGNITAKFHQNILNGCLKFAKYDRGLLFCRTLYIINRPSERLFHKRILHTFPSVQSVIAGCVEFGLNGILQSSVWNESQWWHQRPAWDEVMNNDITSSIRLSSKVIRAFYSSCTHTGNYHRCKKKRWSQKLNKLCSVEHGVCAILIWVTIVQ